MTPVEDLRSAAVLLRRLAKEAPKGPWSVEYFGDRGYPQRITNAQATLIANTYEGGSGLRPIPEYIRLMHPLVGLAVAELLEHIADDLDDDGGHEVSATLRGAIVDNYGSLRSDWTAALALARLILGEPLPVPDGFRPVETVHLPVLGGEPS
jgi:hypothetical protein